MGIVSKGNKWVEWVAMMGGNTLYAKLIISISPLCTLSIVQSHFNVNSDCQAFLTQEILLMEMWDNLFPVKNATMQRESLAIGILYLHTLHLKLCLFLLLMKLYITVNSVKLSSGWVLLLHNRFSRLYH